MSDTFLTLNAMEIAPIVNKIELYHRQTYFNGAIEVHTEDVLSDDQRKICSGYVSFDIPEVKADKYSINWESIPVSLKCKYLTSCLVTELSSSSKILIGETKGNQIEVCTPASKMQTIFSNPYLRFLLKIKAHKDGFLLWIHFKDTLNVSVLNMFEAAHTVEPTKFKRFRYKNKILGYEHIGEGIKGSQLFPISAPPISSDALLLKSENSYVMQWNHIIQFCHQYLLPLTSVQFTGTASLFEQFPSIKPPQVKAQAPCIKEGIIFVYVSIVCKTRKKQLSTKKIKRLLHTLNALSDAACVPLLFHYNEGANLRFKSKLTNANLQNTFEKLQRNSQVKYLFILDGSISNESMEKVKRALDNRKISWIHTPYNAPHFNLLQTSEMNALATKILTIFRHTAPMKEQDKHLIVSMAGIAAQDKTYIGVSCCCGWEGVSKEQELMDADQLNRLIPKVEYNLTLCTMEGNKPDAISFQIDTCIPPELREELKCLLSEKSWEIPLYFMEITSPDKNPYIAFDLSSLMKHPATPYICELAPSEFLVFLPDSVFNHKHPLPMHVKLAKLDKLPLNDQQTQTLLKQVCHFSYQTFWNEKGGSFPVTLMDAELQPGIDR